MEDSNVHSSLDQNPMVIFLITAVILAVSLIWGGSAISSAARDAELATGPSTVGTVHRVYTERDGTAARGVNYQVTEVFYVVDGKTYWEEGQRPALFAPDISSGDEVNVFYQEGNPKIFLFDGWQRNPLAGYLAIGGGVLVSIILTRVNIRTVKRWRKAGRSLWSR